MGSKKAPDRTRTRLHPNARTAAAPVSSPDAAQIAVPEAAQATLLNPFDWTLLTARLVEGQWWLTKQDRQAMAIPLQPVLEALTQQGWQQAMEWQDASHRLLLLKRAADNTSVPSPDVLAEPQSPC